jgi:hypothetical protein
MLKFAKGGRITIESFLDANDRELVKEHLLKTASTNFREAAKIYECSNVRFCSMKKLE